MNPFSPPPSSPPLPQSSSHISSQFHSLFPSFIKNIPISREELLPLIHEGFLKASDKVCAKNMELFTLCPKSDSLDGYVFSCPHCPNSIRETIRKGSFFEGKKLSIPQILLII